MEKELKKLIEVKKKHESELLQIKGVIGVGIGKKQKYGSKKKFYIRVYISHTSSLNLQKIPSTLEGFSVVLLRLGEFNIK